MAQIILLIHANHDAARIFDPHHLVLQLLVYFNELAGDSKELELDRILQVSHTPPTLFL